MASPGWEAVSVQSVVPLVMVTVPVLIEQPPLATVVTVRLDDDVGATGKLVPKVAGVVGCVNVMVCAAFDAFTVRTTFDAAL